jgi:hypothetical protein
MGHYDLDDDLDEFDLREPRWGEARPHSGMGMTALAAAFVAIVLAGCVLVGAVAMDAAQPVPGQADDLIEGVLGFGFLLAGAIAMLGLGIGVVGAFQSDRNPVLAILGATVNGMVVGAIVVVGCLGVLSEFF